MSSDGTPREFLDISERVLVWVAEQKQRMARWERVFEASEHVDASEASAALQPRRDTIRAIELCALASREMAMFRDLYGPLVTGHLDFIGGDPHAPSADLQDERGAPGGVPEAPEGGHGCAQPHGCCCEHCACWC